jgi:hypothetical protein
MTVHVVRAPAGLGKTSLVIQKIKDSPHQRVEIYVPTLNLAREIHAKLAEQNVAALVILGRDQEREPGKTMCRKPKLARAIARIGYPVFPIICMGAEIPGNKYTFKSCEYFGDCSYLKQFESDARVLIYTHAYLPLPRNSLEKVAPTLIVIDESFLSTCLLNHRSSRSEWEEEAREDVVACCVLSKVLKAIDDRKPLLGELRAAGLTPEILREVRADFKTGVSFNPHGTDDALLKNLRTTPRVRLDILAEILEAELATGRSECHGITYDYDEKVLRLHYRRPIARFESGDGSPPTIVIDANADPELLREWFPDLAFKEIPVSRNAYVVQCSSARGSTVSFVPGKNSDPGSKERATRNLAGLEELIRHESTGGTKRVLVVGPQSVTGNSAKEVAPLIACPENGALAHFNGLRGVDVYKDFDTAIIIGRNQPALDDLEDLARALWFDSEASLGFAADYVLETRPYRFRDPNKSMGVEVLVHPDPRIQRLHEQIREGESTQAIDRLRLIHAKKPKRVIVVSNIPLAIDVDELVDLQTLLYRTRLNRAWEQLNGVLPLNPEWLSKTFPHLWPTPGAARTDLRAGAISGHSANDISINGLTTFSYEYRVAGQKRRSRAWSTLPLAETMNELARLQGAPVGVRSVSGDVIGLEGSAAIGEACFRPFAAEACGSSTTAPRQAAQRVNQSKRRCQ